MTTFTLIHVAISLVAIASGFVVLFGLLTGKRLNRWTALFLATTAATSITGFFFPFHGFTPAIAVGILSLLLLPLAIYARYPRHLAGRLRLTYVGTAMFALYLNVFVLIVQSFLKIPALKALAPTQSEPPFAITQLVVLLAFIALTITASLRSRSLQLTSPVLIPAPVAA
jgi:hypothetical protein